MKVNSIYINLPVNDLHKARAFWTKLGFTINEQFSNDDGLCLVLNKGTIYSMLLTHKFFRTFTNRPVSDGSTTQVLFAIEVGSREKVDETIKLAIENGGS